MKAERWALKGKERNESKLCRPDGASFYEVYPYIGFHCVRVEGEVKGDRAQG